MLLGVILAIITGIVAVEMALEKALNHCTSVIIAWQKLIETIKKSRP